MSSLRDTKDQLIAGANAVTLVFLTVVAGLLVAGSSTFLGFDLIASFFGWGEKMSQAVNLPYQGVLAIALTAMPSLVQLAFVAAKMAGLPFAENSRFKALYILSAGLDTVLDIAQMWDGSLVSFGVSTFLSVVVFLALSEFLFIFSLSVFISLLNKLRTTDGLWDMAWEQASTGPSSSRSQQRGRKN